jgi:hypothetical protein
VARCAHDLIEWQQRDEDMHCLGWVCQHCGDLQVSEYHHESWCRVDFCGAVWSVEELRIKQPEPVF